MNPMLRDVAAPACHRGMFMRHVLSVFPQLILRRMERTCDFALVQSSTLLPHQATLRPVRQLLGPTYHTNSFMNLWRM